MRNRTRQPGHVRPEYFCPGSPGAGPWCGQRDTGKTCHVHRYQPCLRDLRSYVMQSGDPAVAPQPIALPEIINLNNVESIDSVMVHGESRLGG